MYFHGTVHAAFEQSGPFSMQDNTCSLVHTVDKNYFLTFPQCLTLQYLLAGSIWLFTQECSFPLVSLFSCLSQWGDCTNIMALWYLTLTTILLNHKYNYLKYNKILIWREKNHFLLFVCIHVELLIRHICFLQNAVSSMMIALSSHFRKLLFCLLDTIWEVLMISSIILWLSVSSMLSSFW